ncbi:MAG: phospholipase D family protein, partial [Pseudomonadota bacterium]
LAKPDLAGSLVGLELFKAAERGVRVRLLVDDAFTKSKDRDLAAFDAHPNIEVRIFNPMSRNSIKAMGYLLDFGRVNRRMHNKAFIVDGHMAIIGGRNIADEYFQIDTSSEFADFDLFVAGPVVDDLGAGFDTYWSDRWSVPVASLYAGASDEEVRAAIAAFDSRAQSPEADIYRRARESRYLSDLREGRIKPVSGTATAVVDPPGKLRLRQGGTRQDTARKLMTAMDRARSDIVLLTPYFVPEAYGAEFFARLAQRGVRVRVVTNSLASTNHPYVHGGYTPYRRTLLKAGIELYEIRADAAQHLGLVPMDSPLKLTMHTKVVVIDDDQVFISSMNWDPRSIKLNSELGLLIDSPSLNRDLRSGIDDGIDDFTFRVGLFEDGRLVWDDLSGDPVLRRFDEPGASGFEKFIADVTTLLPVEGQL